MKTRIKATGVLIDVIPKANPMAQSLGDNLYVCDNMVYRGSELDFVNTQSHIDWEARRFELVKAAMQGVCGNSGIDLGKSTKDGLSTLIIGIADAVLAEYRKGENK